MRRVIEAAMRRRFSPAREAMARLEAKDDWRGTCSQCGVTLRGTPAELRAHRCPEEEAPCDP